MLTKEQIEYLKSLGLDFDYDNLTGDNWCDIEDTVGDRLMMYCLDENYYPNEEGIMCEDILGNLP